VECVWWGGDEVCVCVCLHSVWLPLSPGRAWMRKRVCVDDKKKRGWWCWFDVAHNPTSFSASFSVSLSLPPPPNPHPTMLTLRPNALYVWPRRMRRRICARTRGTRARGTRARGTRARESVSPPPSVRFAFKTRGAQKKTRSFSLTHCPRHPHCPPTFCTAWSAACRLVSWRSEMEGRDLCCFLVAARQDACARHFFSSSPFSPHSPPLQPAPPPAPPRSCAPTKAKKP